MKATPLKSRTLRVYQEDWDAILQFFDTSPDGTTGSEVIREVISLVGAFCREQMEAGNSATIHSANEVTNLVYDRLRKYHEEPVK